MDIYSVIRDAFIYYDTNMEKYSGLFKKIDHSKTIIKKSSHDLQNGIIELRDNDNKLLLSTKTESVGWYFPINNLWVWSWAIPEISKNQYNITKKILDYGIDIVFNPDPNVKIDKVQEESKLLSFFLKIQLTTSRLFIENKVHLDLQMALAAYISKTPVIYAYPLYVPPENKDDEPKLWSIQYYFLLDAK